MGRENTSQNTLRQMQSPIFVSAPINGLSRSKMLFMFFLPGTVYGLVYWRSELNWIALFSAKNWMVLPLTP